MSDTTTGPAPEPTTASQADDEPLGSTGMRALEAERERRRAAVQRADKAEARVTELEAQAGALLAFKGNGDEGAKPTPSVGRPKEKLRGGASPPDLDDQPDYGKVADQIIAPRGF